MSFSATPDSASGGPPAASQRPASTPSDGEAPPEPLTVPVSDAEAALLLSAEFGPDGSPGPVSEPLPSQPAPAEPLPGKSLLREILETVLLTVAIYVAVNFATGRFRIEGSSMEPSMQPNQYVLVDKISYMLGDPRRGDVVVFNYPLATERDFIKRVIGLPGETVTVAAGQVRVNGELLTEPYISAPPTYENSWTLGPDQYFVLGDNRNSSSDSHSWGPLDRQYLIGRAIFIYWPPTMWGLVPHYSYASQP